MCAAPADAREVPCGRVARGTLAAPPSKSVAIRLLVAAALADGVSHVRGLPDAADVAATLAALEALGFGVERRSDEVAIRGAAGGPPAASGRLDVGGSGTALRLLAAVCCLGPGPYVLGGDTSLCARPLGGIEDVVRALGCHATSAGGRPPLTVSGGPCRRVQDDAVRIDASRSSQPVSALLLAASAVWGRVCVEAVGDVVSAGYIRLTCDVLTRFGRSCRAEQTSAADGSPCLRVTSTGSGLVGGRHSVAGDWSGAAFLLGAAAATGGRVALTGLIEGDSQPDACIVDLLRRMGATVAWSEEGLVCDAAGRRGPLQGIRVSLAGAPDLAPLVGALGCLAAGVTEVTDTPHLRIKESDRIGAVVAAARAVGCRAEERADGFVIHGGGATGGRVDPQGDHRIAMAFAVAGLAIPGVWIADPGCVGKSYPTFWDDLARLVKP